MSTILKNQIQGIETSVKEVGEFIGRIVSFNTSLRLSHWVITGEGSYAQHIALEQGQDALEEVTDRLVETVIAQVGDVEITVPATETPKNVVKHTEGFYEFVQEGRKHFSEAYTQAILDDYQEALQQMLYRLKRLK